jgi:hypothetical protein
MKKLIVLALGLGLLSGMAVFADDKPATTDTKKSDTKKKSKSHKKASADASKEAPATK